ADERERIGDGEQNEVVALGRVPQKCSAVGDDRRDSRVGVRTGWMIRLADRPDTGIDLDSVDRPDVVSKGYRDIRPGAGSDDQSLAESPIRKPTVDLVVVSLFLC